MKYSKDKLKIFKGSRHNSFNFFEFKFSIVSAPKKKENVCAFVCLECGIIILLLVVNKTVTTYNRFHCFSLIHGFSALQHQNELHCLSFFIKEMISWADFYQKKIKKQQKFKSITKNKMINQIKLVILYHIYFFRYSLFRLSIWICISKHK